MLKFNIDNSVNFLAEIEKGCKSRIAHIWDEQHNDISCKLGATRAINIRAACAFMVADPRAKEVTTDCGVTIRRGHVS